MNWRLLKILTVTVFMLPGISSVAEDYRNIRLNGTWECGYDRDYSFRVPVPGLADNPSVIPQKSLWYRKEVELPSGGWNVAELELKGARFRPRVYVDGVLVSSAEGGMSRTLHPLPGVRPGQVIALEIELASLKDVPLSDASYIPAVDQWRSNVSSCLWDDVVLLLYRDARVDRVLTDCNSQKGEARLKYRVRGAGAAAALIDVYDGDRKILSLSGTADSGENEVVMDYRGKLEEWSPENPHCNRLEVSLSDGLGRTISKYRQTLNLREFRTKDKQFVLNGKEIRACGGSVVWHRWLRDAEAADVAFDADWFEQNVIRQMKDRGANYLRFHLGVPPERLLDLCDRYGLMVQYEWSFFHGMPASSESLSKQYSSWLDVASRHPSVVLFHPYNETEPDELERVTTVMDSLSNVYPDITLADRDVLHIHRYWWGMSENLGLYYDSYRQFSKPVMLDEFGGIYLDCNNETGGYPMLRPSIKRWLGGYDTPAERVAQQKFAYAKVGEYWRRIGVAGVAAFPVLSSYEDGNNWFLGPVRDGRLKDVWNCMTVVWSPVTVSMDLWNRNFRKGEEITVPVHFINDSDSERKIKAVLSVSDFSGVILLSTGLSANVGPHSRKVLKVPVRLPETSGRFVVRTVLQNPPESVKYPVESAWKVNVLEARVPEKLKFCRIYIPEYEKELRAMAKEQSLNVADSPESSSVVLLGRKSWERAESLSVEMDSWISRGISIVMLDVGDRNLGVAYREGQRNLGNVSGSPIIKSSEISSRKLFAGLSVTSVRLAEGESHLHPSESDSSLWKGLSRWNTRLWNGLRGGLMVPAAGMEPSGLSREAFLSQWTSRGADSLSIVNGPYYAYEYCGFYAYDTVEDSKAAEKYLKDKVAFLVEDMPALALSLPRNTPVRVTDLHREYSADEGGRVSSFVPLAVAGKDLVRTPVVLIRFGEGEGNLILSQLLTSGRLSRRYQDGGKNPALYDEAAVQFVLNMIEKSIEHTSARTGEGWMTHIANASAADTRIEAGSLLTGKWKLCGIECESMKCADEAAGALETSGFGMGRTGFVFSDGSGLAVICGDKILPGTWTGTDESVTLRFSKLFTYSITGRLDVSGNLCRIVFQSDDFASLVSRILAIPGRSDTRRFLKRFNRHSVKECGIVLSKYQEI